MKFDTLKNLVSVPFAILVGAALIAGAVLYTGGRSASIATAPQATETPVRVADPSKLLGNNDVSIGAANAKVTIVEFSDFQCPFCRQFFLDSYGKVKTDYIDTGKVRFVFRHFPLTQLHPGARPAALAAECANDQGKFWQYHDEVFSQQQKQEASPTVVTKTMTFGIPELKTWANAIGLQMSQFNSCLDSQKYASKVDADATAGAQFGVSGTPTLFINGQMVVGAQPYATFKNVIDQELAK